eukprot:scaffold5508_cov104-Cylindrotheca_fusiformis.AAC.4
MRCGQEISSTPNFGLFAKIAYQDAASEFSWDIQPFTLRERLQTSNLILQDQSQKVGIRMSAYSLVIPIICRTWWIGNHFDHPMWDFILPLLEFTSQNCGIQSQRQAQGFSNAICHVTYFSCKI